jgi:hypothetical protein
VEDMRQLADLVIHGDGRVEEGIPAGHGTGVLEVPATVDGEGDSDSDVLRGLYAGGARTVLVADDTALARAWDRQGLVDRVVMEFSRDRDDVVPVPGFLVEAVDVVGWAIRISGGRLRPPPSAEQ